MSIYNPEDEPFMRMVGEAVDARNEWLEDILAGLLSNGVRRNEIEIEEHPGWRILVKVRGEVKYEFAAMSGTNPQQS